jgi:hypothetical protein
VEVSATDGQSGDFSPQIIVNPLSPTRRVEKKGRKWKPVHDESWEEILRENLETMGAPEAEPAKKAGGIAEDGGASQAPAETPLPERNAEFAINSEADFERVIMDIKKMADEPEKLVESHLGVFIEPVQPGKWINSQG